jgi:hypothetical protein
MPSHESDDNAVRGVDPPLTRTNAEENAIREGDPPMPPARTTTDTRLADTTTLLAHTMAILAVYVFATGGLMYANTNWFGLGDVKFGADGWMLYWPLWAIFFSPIVLAAVFIAWSFRFPGVRGIAFFLACLLTTLASLEISFVLDVSAPIVLFECVLLPIAFVVMACVAHANRQK